AAVAQSELQLARAALRQLMREERVEAIAVLRMSPGLERSLPPLLETETVVVERQLVREEALVLGSEDTHELRREVQDLLELRLTLAQRLRQLLLLGDIDRRAHEPLKDVAVNHGPADAADMTTRAIGALNPLREIEAALARQDLLNLARHGIAILGVHDGQILRDARCMAVQREAVNPKHLRRPVLETCGVECPGTRVGKTLSFRQVELCLFSFVDIDAGPVPPDDVAGPVPQRDFPVEQPAVFPVGPQHACFHLERLAARQRGAPLAQDQLQFVGMDELGPAPALNGLERHAQKLQPSLVEVIQVSIRT